MDWSIDWLIHDGLAVQYFGRKGIKENSSPAFCTATSMPESQQPCARFTCESKGTGHVGCSWAARTPANELQGSQT